MAEPFSHLSVNKQRKVREIPAALRTRVGAAFFPALLRLGLMPFPPLRDGIKHELRSMQDPAFGELEDFGKEWASGAHASEALRTMIGS